MTILSESEALMGATKAYADRIATDKDERRKRLAKLMARCVKEHINVLEWRESYKEQTFNAMPGRDDKRTVYATVEFMIEPPDGKKWGKVTIPVDGPTYHEEYAFLPDDETVYMEILDTVDEIRAILQGVDHEYN